MMTYEELCKEYVDVQARMQVQINRLREENAALRRRLNEMPSTLTELQDRVTLLESRK